MPPLYDDNPTTPPQINENSPQADRLEESAKRMRALGKRIREDVNRHYAAGLNLRGTPAVPAEGDTPEVPARKNILKLTTDQVNSAFLAKYGAEIAVQTERGRRLFVYFREQMELINSGEPSDFDTID